MENKSKWGLRLGYGSGDLACGLINNMMGTYLMIFYTDVFGLALGVTGSLMLVTRIIDAVTDILMGMIIDKTNTKWGKCRPYFIWGAIPFVVIAVLAFTVPPFGMTGKIIYAYVTYILLSTGYTLVNVPLSAILPSLTSDLQERNILVSVRLVFSVIAGTIVTSFTMPLVNQLGQGDNAKGYFMTALIFGIISLFTFFFTFKHTEEKVHAVNEKETVSVKKFIKTLNFQWLLFIIVTFLLFLAFMTRASSIMYYFQYNLNRVNLMPIVGVLTNFAGLPATIGMPWIVKKCGKRNTMMIGCSIVIAGSLAMLINHIAVILGGITIATLGFNLIMSCRFAISPDIIDYGEYRSGTRTSGMLSATEGFVAKLAMGVSGSLIAGILSWGGYVANAEQTTKALFSIQLGFLWVPILASVGMILCMMIFKVEKEMPEVQKCLAERRLKNE